jgi:CHAT domain-containing protein/tetratricopeptide (TPR) repeat protein
MPPHDSRRSQIAPSNYQRRSGRLHLPRTACAALSIFLIAPHILAGIVGNAFAPAHTAAQSGRPGELTFLSVGGLIGREIKGGESNLFGVSMEAGQYARLTVRRLGVDLLVNITAPGGGLIATYESPAGPQSPMVVSVIAQASGVYNVEVRPVEKWAAVGRYEVLLEVIRPPALIDEKRLAAQRMAAEGRRQQLLDTEDSHRAAVASYENALALWRELNDPAEEANILQFIAQTYKAHGRSYFEKTVDGYQQALARRGEGDPQAKAYTLLGLAEVYRDLSDPAKSLPHYEQALELFKAGGNRRGQAAALFGMGLAKARRQEMDAALKYYEQALGIYGEADVRDRHEEARTLHAMGGAFDVLGKSDQAQEFFERALEGWRETGDLAQEGNTYSSLAKRYDDRGMWQAALDLYDKALDLYAQGEAASERERPAIRSRRASTLYNLAYTHATLGDYPKALELLDRSLVLRDTARGKGSTLMLMGYFHALAGDPSKALELARQALALQEGTGDGRVAETYTVMGVAHARKGEHEQALEFYDRALAIQQDKKTRAEQAEAITQGWRGESCAALGAHEQALASYARARELWLKSGELNGVALTLVGMARVERDRKNLPAALKHVENALAVIEPMRSNVTSQQLRVSYFATKVDYYELYIDISMRLRNERSSAALTAAAFEASERARARSLLETLAEARIEAGPKTDPKLAALVEEYRRTQRALRSKETTRLQVSKDKEGTDGTALEFDISRLGSARDRAEAQIRSYDPSYAALMYPQPLNTAEVQRLLDDDTLLLEFALGDERSYVWAVTATELHGYILPPRSEIEETALRLEDLLRSGQPLPFDTASQRRQRMARAEAEYWPQAAAFSRTLLGRVASLSKKKRLILVADGQLRYIPFGALPRPDVTDAPGSPPGSTPLDSLLGRSHEIVSLPSASILSVLRQTARREPPSKFVAVFADPVFEKDDPRIKPDGSARPAATAERRDALTQALRDTGDVGGTWKLPRLLASGREARGIISLVPAGSAMEATGFKANRENVTSAQLSQYRVVHFATHGILNEKNPELSGVVLSLYDEQGHFREEGFLQLRDIYSLKLPVELVVLSACRTGLGQEVRGEGLIGLTRGFMYAGAPRVIASLWKVDDDATAELMKLFYQEMLKEETTPAAALGAAQVALSKQKGRSHPYYWAGFVLHGEPR